MIIKNSKLKIFNGLVIISILSLVMIMNDEVIENPVNDDYKVKELINFAIKNDENADGDSNIDASANIGTSNSTYLDTQTLDAVYQGVLEGQGSGYVAPTDVEDYLDAITDSQNPTDLGTYSNWNEMQDADLVFNTLTEFDNGGGGGGQIEISPTSAGEQALTNYNDADGSLSEDSAYYDLTNTSTAGRISKGNEDMVRLGFSSGYSDLTTSDAFYFYYKKDRSGGGKDNWVCPYDTSTTIATGNCIKDVGASGTGWSPAFTITSGFLTDLADLGSGSFAVRYFSTGGGGTSLTDSMEIGEAYGLLTQAGGNNYEFDREFSFSSLDFDDTGGEELAIRTGVIGTESLKIDIWDSSAWVNIVTIVDANDNVWINTSISSYLDAGTEYFRFIGNTETGDTVQNTWELDSVLIHSWNNVVNDYELDWEHQSVSVPTGANYFYSLTLYGKSTEDMDVFLWNSSSSSWNTVKLFTITSTLQWYNFSFSGLGFEGSTITWNYRDIDKALDSVQSELSIDYAGIYVYSIAVSLTELTGSVTVIPVGSDTTLNENPFNIVIDSGENFNIEIRGIDTLGTPISSNWMYFDVDNNPAGYTQLTSSWQVLYSNQDYTVTALQFWIWANIPSPEAIDTYTFDLEIRIIIP